MAALLCLVVVETGLVVLDGRGWLAIFLQEDT